ncbi:TPA: GNAT family N-acetyltransferase [Vibrio parahaemolyticus]
MIEIRAVNYQKVTSAKFRSRFESGRSSRTKEYVAFYGDRELAALIYENWQEKSLGFVYEIIVLPEYRNQGLGSLMLEFAETTALELGCSRIELDSHPLDDDTEREWLVSWYESSGYIKESKTSERMYKKL